jgi:hypothetical protein
VTGRARTLKVEAVQAGKRRQDSIDLNKGCRQATIVA